MVTAAMEEKQDEQHNDKNKCEATMKIFGSMSSMKKWYSVGEESSGSGHDSASTPAKITLKKLTPFDARKTLKKIDTGQGDRSTLQHIQSSSQPSVMSTAESSLPIFDFEKALKCGMVILQELGNQKIYRCNICNLTCTGHKPISDHLEGQKHKKNLKMFPSKVSEYLAAVDNAPTNKSPVSNESEGIILDQTAEHERINPENNIGAISEPLCSQSEDEIADQISIKLMGNVSELEAVPSIGKEKIAVIALIPKLFVDMDTALKIGIVSVDTEMKIYSCNVCNLTSHGPKPMIEHIEGQRHKKNLREFPVSTTILKKFEFR